MARGRMRFEWDQTALLWSLTANLNRDPKEKPEPFLPSDVHPLRTAEEYQSDYGGRDEKTIASIRRTHKITRLDHGIKSNRSREGFSQAHR